MIHARLASTLAYLIIAVVMLAVAAPHDLTTHGQHTNGVVDLGLGIAAGFLYYSGKQRL